MISDILTDAIASINRHLSDPAIAKRYDGAIGAYVRNLRDEMQLARDILCPACAAGERGIVRPQAMRAGYGPCSLGAGNER